MATNKNGTRSRAGATPRGQARLRRFSFVDSIALKLCVSIVVLVLGLVPEYVTARENAASTLQPASDPLSAPQGAPTLSAPEAQTETSGRHHRAYFGRERASHEARHLANWIVDSADNHGLPFVILDKIEAKIFVFDAGGRVQGAAPALLGAARGDDTVPGIGDREYADMPLETRTTPAGRFVAALGQDSHGEDVVWVDYDAAVAIHRVITTKPEERRLQRLATPTPLDNRISYG